MTEVSSGDGPVRSHTDPLSNVVVLSALDIDRHLPEILERDLPIATLPTFMHEATHHWCFDSPVGLALHLLFLRARRAAVLSEKGKSIDEDGWTLLDSVVRYEVALTFLRPFSEGLALFAEHDAVPGRARTISTPARLAGALYGSGYAVLSGTNWDGMPLVLAAGRVSSRHVRRKADLFIQPMTCSGGGYLPGYLLIKGIMREAYELSPLFQDTDFLLQFLRWHFFEDWVLVARLLDPSKQDIGAIDSIAERLSSRMYALFTQNLTHDAAQRFERLCEAGKLERLPIKSAGIVTDIGYLPLDSTPEAEDGRKWLQAGLGAYFATWPEDPTQRAWFEHDVKEVGQRSFVPLGNLTVEARPQPNGLDIFSERGRLLTIPSDWLARTAIVSGTAELDIVCSSETADLFLAITRDGQVIHCRSIRDGGAPSVLPDLVVDLKTRSLLAAGSRTAIRERLDASELTYVVDNMCADVEARLDQFVLPAALLRVSQEDLSGVMERTAAKGLRSLFGDLDVLKDAAAASLCLPSPYNLNAIASFHKWKGGDASTSIARANEIVREQLGFSPFAVQDGVWMNRSFL